MSGASVRSQISSGDAREVSIHRRQPAPSAARRKLERERLPIGIDHEVKHPARRPPRREGEAMRFVAPIRLIKFDAVNLNVSLT